VRDAIILGKARPRGRRWARGLGWTVLVLTLVLGVGYAIVMKMTAIDPPPAEPARELPLEVRGERAYVGPSWLSRERGVWEYHLEGDPYAMGYAHTRLGNRLLQDADDYMFTEMYRYVPSKIALFLIRVGVRLKYRHLPDHIPLERQREIAGEARGYLDRHGDFLPTYHRLIFYHALHDITQSLEHSPLLGCTAFAAAGAATPNGHLIIGRNFDFEGPEPLDRDKAILFYKPAGKIPFASVAWTGMSGVVTGLNAQGIFVSVNAARTDDKGKDGIPVELLVRQILERARSIDDAVAMVKEAQVMVPDFYLVGDGKTGESAVIERSPTRTEVRRSHDTTLLTNHALTPAFAKDTENDRLRRYTTSGERMKRLTELVKQARGSLDPRRAVEILRDKRGEGGEPLALGNRNALDALIATHSVVVDATSLQIWVSAGPHCLGKYVGFDLKKELEGEDRPPPPSFPEDPIGQSDELRLHRQAEAELSWAEKLAKQGDAPHALEQALRAEALDERLPEAHKLIGDLTRASDRERARREYQRFLDLRPPYLKDIEEVKGTLSTL
jgi:tetratricopeptide (TPR) repeat protein